MAQTSMEALAAKGACHALGYFSDPFLDEFGIKWKRKSPIIHRGEARGNWLPLLRRRHAQHTRLSGQVITPGTALSERH